MYIKKYYYARPSMFKLMELFSTNNKKDIRNLATYLFKAFDERNKTYVRVCCMKEHVNLNVSVYAYSPQKCIKCIFGISDVCVYESTLLSIVCLYCLHL